MTETQSSDHNGDKENPGSRYLTLRGYGIRAPGAVALGTVRPSHTETIRKFGPASRTPPPHSP